MSANCKANRLLYDNPTAPPQKSNHWACLNHGDSISGNNDEELIHSYKELLSIFQSDVAMLKSNDDTPMSKCGNVNDSNGPLGSKKQSYQTIAIWSCIIGYCEALSTHRDASRRYTLFPVPIGALRRMVLEEFLPLLLSQESHSSHAPTKPPSNRSSTEKSLVSTSKHRNAARNLANTLWKRAQNKKSSSFMQDEVHANSLYVCLRGNVDGKSLDCFGAALLVVVGMNILGYDSFLTLSEDHAYETHWEDEIFSAGTNVEGTEFKFSLGDKDAACKNNDQRPKKLGTCEVAIPGNTKIAQTKRGKEISETFIQNDDMINAETSWLYMAKNPVVCSSPGMALAALISNINCDVENRNQSSKKLSDCPSSHHIVSDAMYQLKRDLLWILYEAGSMERFPFALIELGECEEHKSTVKGMEWVDISKQVRRGSDDASNYFARDVDKNNTSDDNGTISKVMVLKNEKLFLDAIYISRSIYNDAQVYPYLYAGHYHKDAGQEQEYRLVEALRLYSEAARVASQYRYHSKDCMQLMKHMTTVASLICRDILHVQSSGNGSDNLCCDVNGKEKVVPREWSCGRNAVAAASWLIAFFDSLLFWEEQSKRPFVEILDVNHRYGLGKLFQTFTFDVRVNVFKTVNSSGKANNRSTVVTEEELIYFRKTRSKRFADDGLLVLALTREKVTIKDIHMTLPCITDVRKRKRTRKK